MKKLFLLFLLLISISSFSQNIDINTLKFIHNPQPTSSDGFFRFMSNSDVYIAFGVPVTMTAIGLIKKDNPLTRKGYEALAAVTANFVFTFGIKKIVNRERPFNKYPNYITNKTYKSIKDPSFPSGHTSIAFSLASSLSLQYHEWYIAVPTYMWAGTVGYSRMDLGAHYPSDVIGGALVGIGSSYLIHTLNNKYNK